MSVLIVSDEMVWRRLTFMYSFGSDPLVRRLGDDAPFMN